MFLAITYIKKMLKNWLLRHSCIKLFFMKRWTVNSFQYFFLLQSMKWKKFLIFSTNKISSLKCQKSFCICCFQCIQIGIKFWLFFQPTQIKKSFRFSCGKICFLLSFNKKKLWSWGIFKNIKVCSSQYFLKQQKNWPKLFPISLNCHYFNYHSK